MQNMPTIWNQQLSGYVFSKVIECLKQNIRKGIDCKNHKLQNKWTKYKIFELKYANRNIIS